MKQEKKQKAYHVGEIARYFGVSTDTLRLYDRMGILQTAKDPNNSYRTYGREDIIALDFVLRLKRMNIALDDIKMMVNDASIERMEAMMQVQEKVLEQKLAEVQIYQAMVKDYQRCFSNLIQHRGQPRITVSPVMICRTVENYSLLEAMTAFDHLSRAHVAKGTFIMEPAKFMDPSTWENFERSEVRESAFTYALTLVDDENFAARLNLAADGFQVIPSQKCVHAVVRAETGEDYSEFVMYRDYVEDRGLTLVGDPMYRLCAMQNYGEAYYEFWAPIK